MNIYDYLKLDHRRVDQLFKQFEDSSIEVRKRQIAAVIAQELLVHAHSEQETFYKTLQQFDTTEEDALHGQEEHQEIEEQITHILLAEDYNSSWEHDVQKLKKMVEEHVKKEEGVIFKRAQQVLSDEDASILKEQMHYLKQQMILAIQKKTELNTQVNTNISTNKNSKLQVKTQSSINSNPPSSKTPSSAENRFDILKKPEIKKPNPRTPDLH